MDSQAEGLEALAALSNALADAVERASRATVMVNGRRRLPATGFCIAPGLILTANHVLERDSDIAVGLGDQTEIPVTLAGRDPGSDLAVLRLQEGDLAPIDATVGDARVGQIVLALGCPTLNGIQASMGVVSAIEGPARTHLGGSLERYLRTDAIAYPGFSGGPLVATDGRAIGINTSGLSMGTSLTIPIAGALRIAAVLAEHGRVPRGYMGIRTQSAALQRAQQEPLGRDQATGLLLLWVEEGGPADRAGLMVGDILVALGEHQLLDPDELQNRLLDLGVGSTARVQVVRGDGALLLDVTLGERA